MKKLTKAKQQERDKVLKNVRKELLICFGYQAVIKTVIPV